MCISCSNTNLTVLYLLSVSERVCVWCTARGRLYAERVHLNLIHNRYGFALSYESHRDVHEVAERSDRAGLVWRVRSGFREVTAAAAAANSMRILGEQVKGSRYRGIRLKGGLVTGVSDRGYRNVAAASQLAKSC